MSRIAKARGLSGDRVRFEPSLTPRQQESVRRGVQGDIRDIEQGRYRDYDGEGLRALAKELFAAAFRRRAVGRQLPERERDN